MGQLRICSHITNNPLPEGNRCESCAMPLLYEKSVPLMPLQKDCSETGPGLWEGGESDETQARIPACS